MRSISLFVFVTLLLSSLGTGFCAVSNVTIALDKVNYAPDETVYASVLVQDESSNPLPNQLVIISWRGPSDGLIREDRELTEASGTIQASLHLGEWNLQNVTFGLGTYAVQAESGNSTATAYFQVKTLRTFAMTIVLPNMGIPIWLNGVQRSQGNTTLILSEGSYTLEVPKDYSSLVFQAWRTPNGNYSSPRLTILLSQEITVSAIYESSATTQTLNWVFPYLIAAIVVVGVVVCLIWAYREGYLWNT